MRFSQKGLCFVGTAVACVALLTGCSDKNSYDAAEGALRDWLTAVESGSPRACEFETAKLHDALLAADVELGGPRTNCADRVKRMSKIDQPRPDSDMDVPAWDPSGAASVDVFDSRTNTVKKFGMLFEDGRWLVDSTLS